MLFADILLELHRSQQVFLVSLIVTASSAPLAIVIAEVRARLEGKGEARGFGVVTSTYRGDSHENA